MATQTKLIQAQQAAKQAMQEEAAVRQAGVSPSFLCHKSLSWLQLWQSLYGLTKNQPPKKPPL